MSQLLQSRIGFYWIEQKAPYRPRVRAFLDNLKLFLDQGYGRRTDLAIFLGLPRQAVTDMLNGRQNPTAEQVLAIQEYLGEPFVFADCTGP